MNVIALSQTLIEPYLDSDDWCLQEIHSGSPIVVRYAKGEVTALDPICRMISVPNGVEEAVRRIGEGIGGPVTLIGVLDGENFSAFDCLEYSDDLKVLKYVDRYMVLGRILSLFPRKSLSIIPAYFSPREKRSRFNKLKRDRSKGVVLRKTADVLAKGDNLIFKVSLTREEAKVLPFRGEKNVK